MKTLSDVMDAAMDAIPRRSVPPPEPTQEAVAADGDDMVSRGYLPYDRAAFTALATWMAGPRRLGVLLTGRAGVGKTMFVDKVLGLRVTPASAIVNAYRKCEGYNAGFWYEAFHAYDCEQNDGAAIDDLGQEPSCVLYGQREEVLDEVICARYRAWQKTGVRTFVTTNLSASEIDQRYGRRILDRLREMCLPVEFTGDSNRRRV